MPTATKRIDDLLDGLTTRHEVYNTPSDKQVVLAAQILRDLCNSDFRIADRVDEAIRASESQLGTLDTELLNETNAKASQSAANQKEAVKA